MDLLRKTYAEINIKNVKENVQKIINKYNDYKYYFGVVKADCYGHGYLKTVQAILDGGCNYLAVATLEEALQIRLAYKNIPILCLGVIDPKHISLCIKNNITITINSLEYLKQIDMKKLKKINVHLKINTGMNRLGISNNTNLLECYKILEKNNIQIEGIYTHIYNALNKEHYENQVKNFKKITENIDLNKIKIVHISASEATINYPKLDFANGCRLGIAMYGFHTPKELELKSTFSLKSEVIQVNELKKGETVGYNATYTAKQDEKIAVIAIGYADGIIRKNKGRYVYINNKKYEIVGNICMDMMFVKVDENVKVHDIVEILKDNEHIEYVAKHLETIPYEVICLIGKRVNRVYL
ncbi:MAG: alanine racemase [Clostridia bacterium]|nr:alanine racemase [Clostridia bacterium]